MCFNLKINLYINLKYDRSLCKQTVISKLSAFKFYSFLYTRAAERIFIGVWGGGGKDKRAHTCQKGHYITVHMQIILNVLMKHQCRHKVSFYNA